MPIPSFVHLRLHSEYSVVDGTVRIDEAVAAAAAGRHAGARADRLANVFGMVKFYKAARAARHQADHRLRRLDHPRHRARSAASRAPARARTRAGYLRLCDWLSRAYRTNQHRGRAELQREWFDEGTDGLIALSGGRRRRRRPARCCRATPGRRAARAARGRRAFPDRLLPRSAARRPSPTTMRSSRRPSARERARAAGRRHASGAVR